MRLRHGTLRYSAQNLIYRGVAQLAARLVWDQDAGGSSPLTPTTALVLSADNTGVFYVVKNAKRLTGETSLPVCPSGLPAGILALVLSADNTGIFYVVKNAKRLTGETSLPVCPSGLPARKILVEICSFYKLKITFTPTVVCREFSFASAGL